MPSVSALPSIFLVFMGSMDCLTTVIGVVYFGTVELNPVISGLVNSNIGAFVVVKLAVTLLAAGIFIFAERSLLKLPDHCSKSFLTAQRVLKISYAGIVVFLLVVVINNVLVILRML